jgi:hypothetical protein
LAIACDVEQTLFVRGSASETDAVRNKIFIRDRDLNTDCVRESEAHSTSHMRNSSGDKWAEVGYHEDFGPSSSHTFNAFWEVGYGDTIICDLGCGPSIACCDWAFFKVENVDGTQRWQFFFDWGANGGYTQIGPNAGEYAAFGQGIPMGETARRGGNATGALDDHRELEKKLCSTCNYTPWQSNFTYSDSISNYHHTSVADDHYVVEHD